MPVRLCLLLLWVGTLCLAQNTTDNSTTAPTLSVAPPVCPGNYQGVNCSTLSVLLSFQFECNTYTNTVFNNELLQELVTATGAVSTQFQLVNVNCYASNNADIILLVSPDGSGAGLSPQQVRDLLIDNLENPSSYWLGSEMLSQLLSVDAQSATVSDTIINVTEPQATAQPTDECWYQNRYYQCGTDTWSGAQIAGVVLSSFVMLLLTGVLVVCCIQTCNSDEKYQPVSRYIR